MICNIVKDTFFLSQKSDLATKEDLNICMDLIDTLIEQIRLKDAVTAGAIANCIENFEYDKLLKLISQARSHE